MPAYIRCCCFSSSSAAGVYVAGPVGRAAARVPMAGRLWVDWPVCKLKPHCMQKTAPASRAVWHSGQVVRPVVLPPPITSPSGFQPSMPSCQQLSSAKSWPLARYSLAWRTCTGHAVRPCAIYAPWCRASVPPTWILREANPQAAVGALPATRPEPRLQTRASSHRRPGAMLGRSPSICPRPGIAARHPPRKGQTVGLRG